MVIKHIAEPIEIKKGLWLTGYFPMTRDSDKKYFTTKRDALKWFENQDVDLEIVRYRRSHGFYSPFNYPVYKVK